MLHPADIELRLHEGPPPAPEATLKAVAEAPIDAIPAAVDEASRE
jgi:hypothetical protein